jgi:hypothetical protein
MAIDYIYSRKVKEHLASAQVNFGALGVGQGSPHIFKIILMSNGFVFDPTTHAFLDDVNSDELASGNGYTTGGALLGTLTLTFDTSNRLLIAFPTVAWTAVGGVIGPTPGAIIYSDEGSTDATKLVVAYIDFNGNKWASGGGQIAITNGRLRIN